MSANNYKNKDSLKDLPESSSSVAASDRLRDALIYHEQQKIAESNGFEIVGGDTDSLFLIDIKNGNNVDKQILSRLISESKEKIGIDLDS